MSRASAPRKRAYRLSARAEQQARTRRRIADAAVALHGSIGPARTTISAIAERAEVERLTVYRHFPDERALFAACSGRFLEEHPPPDLAGLMAIPQAAARLEAVLVALYGYYRRTEPMMTALLRDAAVVPLVAEYLGPYLAMLAELADGLTTPVAPARDRRDERAACGHALAFTTWRSLALDEGLSDEGAAALMARFVNSLGQRP